MSRFAHHAATLGPDAGFETLQARYVAAPAALWGVAMLAVVAAALLQAAPQPATVQAPEFEDVAGTAYGA